VREISFDCQVNGDNNGCHTTASCPPPLALPLPFVHSGEVVGPSISLYEPRIIGATAACNLEYGTISDSTLATVYANRMQVVVASDSVMRGLCYVGPNSLHSGVKIISGIGSLTDVSVGCQEHDANGGDCHIKGVLYCR
jgi:hypothetical protein